jgi:peptidoglycan/xylan/chitin deacetylase (PgdA/CDA1 family)
MNDAAAVPRVVISLDFELRWGVHDAHGLDFDGYRANIEDARAVVPAVLELFASHGIRATWATVGAIGCRDWDEYFRRAPAPPRYENAAFAIRRAYADLDPDGRLHFAPELVAAIVAAPGQELGTHTFSHIFLRERGVVEADALADLEAVHALFIERFGTIPCSLVYPRNQSAFIDAIRRTYIAVWRGNPKRWYYEREDSENNGLLPRAFKLADAINPLTRRAAPLEEDMTRASLFLRLNLPAPLWKLHRRRIASAIATTAPGEIFHLWLHPHNVGPEGGLRYARLAEIIDLIAEARARGAVQSCSMEDLVGCSKNSVSEPRLAAPAL